MGRMKLVPMCSFYWRGPLNILLGTHQWVATHSLGNSGIDDFYITKNVSSKLLYSHNYLTTAPWIHQGFSSFWCPKFLSYSVFRIKHSVYYYFLCVDCCKATRKCRRGWQTGLQSEQPQLGLPFFRIFRILGLRSDFGKSQIISGFLEYSIRLSNFFRSFYIQKFIKTKITFFIKINSN